MMRRMPLMSMIALASLAFGAAPAAAQVKTIDPTRAIDSDLQSSPPPSSYAAPSSSSADQSQPVDAGSQQVTPADNGGYPVADQTPQSYPAQTPAQAPAQTPQNQYAAPATGQVDSTQRQAVSQSADTYDRNDLMSAAEGVFGKGAEGLAGIIEKILNDQGQPNAYIAGREASGAFVVGLRYGSGILYSKIEGQQPVYWTGPSVGFDVGGDANKVFVLVYNLYDTEELFKRFPAGEGHLYFVGGFSASYLRSGNTVLIPVRLGVGWRAGVNVGYMKFSHHEKWLPF
jgi:hypothetical protein